MRQKRYNFVDPACPLDWSHPLNRGVVADWSILPNAGWSGGNTLRDLVRGGKRTNDGTFVGAPTWWRGACPGALGGIKFTGVSGQAISSPSPAMAFPLTIFAEVTPLSGAAFLLAHDASANNGFHMGWNGSAGSSLDFTLGGVGAYTPTFAVGALANFRSIICMTISANGGTLNTYFNRIPGNEGLLTATPITVGTMIGTPNRLLIGNCFFTNSPSFILHRMRIFSRVLSANDVRLLYQEQRRGNPTLWRWATARTYSIPATVAASRVNWHRLLRKAS